MSCWLAEESGKHDLPSPSSSSASMLLPVLLNHGNSIPIVHLAEGSVDHHKYLETCCGKAFQAVLSAGVTV